MVCINMNNRRKKQTNRNECEKVGKRWKRIRCVGVFTVVNVKELSTGLTKRVLAGNV